MNKRVYFIAIIAFVVGMVELIISGILDLIAEAFEITLAQAGSLITVFALILAVASPILLVLTAKVERKKLMLICLYIFFIGCVMTVFSPNYIALFTARIILSFSAALLIILCLVMAPNLVEEKYKGRAIGIVSMGTSASLVLGVPIGIFLGERFGWQAPFILITILTFLSIIGVHILMQPIEPKATQPLSALLIGFKKQKLFFALLTTFLYMTGHTALYAYFKPYLAATTNLDANMISIMYLVFGIAAVSGGGLGGAIADVFGSIKTMVSGLILFSIIFFIIPLASGSPLFYLIMIIIWGILSWGISPAMQSYLIETTPSHAGVMQSLNNSALHLGVATGSMVGGFVVNELSILQNPLIGGIIIIFSLLAVIISVRSTYIVPNKLRESQ